MRKFTTMFVAMLLCFSFASCNIEIQTGSSETEKTPEATTTSFATETTVEDVAKTEKPKLDFEPNYGIYRSLIEAYEVTAHQTYDGSPSYIDEEIYEYLEQDSMNYFGAPYFKLIDFDGNGVLELVVTALNITNVEELYDVVCREPVTKVFTINSDNELVFVDDFTLFNDYVNDREHLSLVTTVVDGETYIITGTTYDYFPCFDYTIWKYNDEGFDFVLSLYADINTKTSEYENAEICGEEATSEEVEELLLKWISNSTFSTFVGADQEIAEENIDKPMNEAWQFLCEYGTVKGDVGDAVFYDGKFVIFEAKPYTDAEKLVKQYFKDCVLPDEDYLYYIALTGFNYNKFSSFPCAVVRDFSTVKKEDFGEEYIYMSEQLASEEYAFELDRHGMENEFAVRVESEFFIDFDVLELDPQSGRGENTDWFIIGENSNSVSDYTIFATLGTSDTMWRLDLTDAFDVEFLGYRYELSDENGNLTLQSVYDNSVYIPLQNVLTREEILQTEFVDDFNGDEIYLIRSCEDYEFGVSVYERDENDEICGIQAIGTYDKPIILSCNNAGISSGARITVNYPTGNTYEYSPSVNPQDLCPKLGKFGKYFDWIPEDELEFTLEIDTESYEHLAGTWSIDGSDDTAYFEIADNTYVSYYPTGTAESYANFEYDGIFTGVHRYSLFSEGDLTGSRLYYINEDTILMQNAYGEWTTFNRK